MHPPIYAAIQILNVSKTIATIKENISDQGPLALMLLTPTISVWAARGVIKEQQE
jgi:hypothetical protein